MTKIDIQYQTNSVNGDTSRRNTTKVMRIGLLPTAQDQQENVID